LTDSPAELSDADLYVYLRDLIEHEQLFLNPLFERQTLIDRTGLTKERIGAAFSQGSDHGRLTTLISELRLDYAVRLMNEQPELSVEKICQASGFANADTFTRNFKAKYGMTPTAYRTTLS
jgi:AraC-like DNA-binding protein